MAERLIDENKANSPPTASDVYLIASRLKRMIVASLAATVANSTGDQAEYVKKLNEFQEISVGLNPLLDALVYAAEPADG